jgi:hypothetical protein
MQDSIFLPAKVRGKYLYADLIHVQCHFINNVSLVR